MLCINNYLQQCSADGISWQTVQVCEFGCSANSCLEASQLPIDNNLLVISGVAAAIVIISVIAIKKKRSHHRKKKPKKKEKQSEDKKSPKKTKPKEEKPRESPPEKKPHEEPEKETDQASVQQEKPVAQARKPEQEGIAYCMKCHKKVNPANPELVTLKNGKRAIKGECPDCKTRVFSFNIKAKDENPTEKPKEEKETVPQEPKQRPEEPKEKDTETPPEESKKPEEKASPPEEPKQMQDKPSAVSTEDLAYCMGCKKKVPVKEAETITLKNGRSAERGKCQECGRTVMRFLKKNYSATAAS
jgi:outer membrane biosynthesis protein TonB